MPYSYNGVNKGLLSKFLAPPGCSKSHQLVTISRHYRSHVGLKTAGGAVGKAYRRPHTSYRGGACNRQLPRIPLFFYALGEWALRAPTRNSSNVVTQLPMPMVT